MNKYEISFCIVLTTLFIALRLFKIINWNIIFVLSPLLILILFWLIMLFIGIRVTSIKK